VYGDTRAAWTGPLPGIPGERLRVEAAAYHGRVVSFQLIAPWTRATRSAEFATESTRATLWSAIGTIIVFSVFVAAALIARHNLRKGRGDRRGARQIAWFVLLVAFAVGLFDGKHFANPGIEMERFFIGQPWWAAGLLWLLYIAVEPYVRRFWPTTVVSWSRLMAGGWRDPLVGRDVLIGVSIGLLLHTIYLANTALVQRFGQPLPPEVPNLGQLLGTHAVIARTLNQVFNAIFNALFAVFGMVLLKILVRREGAAAPAAIALMTLTSARDVLSGPHPFLNLAATFLSITLIVVTIQRMGLLAIMAAFLVNFMISDAVLTFDTTRWFFADAVLLMLIPAALAFYGFYASRGDEPLLGRRLLD